MALSEPQFAALVDTSAGPDGRRQLIDLLGEDHPAYDQRGTAATVRMRGWALLALARIGLCEASLVFVLEELDTGTDPYLVAAAARALRSYPAPSAEFAPFLMRCIANIRYQDQPVSFHGYGEYALSSGSSPVRELLETLAWLGPLAIGILPDLETLRAQPGGFSKKLAVDLDHALASIRGAGQITSPASCCDLPGGLGRMLWASGRGGSEPVESIVFEDQQGESISFKDLFPGRPSIVVFFYTRCDNPLKCSLTVTKLARIQRSLESRGLIDQIGTAAITYDPGFDLPERLRLYGEGRGVRFDAQHRMLRATGGFSALRKHFRLGVNFIESLVNRHRIELFILDANGRIAAGFERIHWDESQVVDRAVEILKADVAAVSSRVPRQAASRTFGTLASLAVAFFPKCPVCWGAYLSMSGIAGIQRLRFSPALEAVLVLLMLVNVASVWRRGRATGSMLGSYLVSAGAIAIIASRFAPGWESVAVWGVWFTLAGSLWSVVNNKKAIPAHIAARLP